jgi:hypothetical protein
MGVVSMLKLYEIDECIEKLNSEIEIYASEHEGEIPDNIDAELEQMQLNREQKIGSIARWIRSLNAEYDALSIEYKRLKARRDSIDKRIESVKRFLSGAVGIGNKFKDSVVSIYWKKSESINVIDPDLLPIEFQKITIEPNKTAIKEALKSGEIQESENITIEEKESIVIR